MGGLYFFFNYIGRMNLNQNTEALRNSPKGMFLIQ